MNENRSLDKPSACVFFGLCVMWLVYGVAWLGNASGSVRPIAGMEPETFLNGVFYCDATATLLAWIILVFFARHNRRALYLCSLVSVVILVWILFASPFSPINPRDSIRTEVAGERGGEGISVTDYVKSLTATMRDRQRDGGGDDIHFPYAVLSPSLVRQAQGEGALVLDLRPREEFEGEHIPGAVNMPFEELPRRINEIPRSELTILNFTEVADPERPDVRVKPTNEELNPVIREVVFARGSYVAFARGGLEGWKSAGYQTVGYNVRLMNAEAFKRLVDENRKAWEEFERLNRQMKAGELTYPNMDDIVNAKGQPRE